MRLKQQLIRVNRVQMVGKPGKTALYQLKVLLRSGCRGNKNFTCGIDSADAKDLFLGEFFIKLLLFAV